MDVAGCDLEADGERPVIEVAALEAAVDLARAEAAVGPGREDRQLTRPLRLGAGLHRRRHQRRPQRRRPALVQGDGEEPRVVLGVQPRRLLHLVAAAHLREVGTRDDALRLGHARAAVDPDAVGPVALHRPGGLRLERLSQLTAILDVGVGATGDLGDALQRVLGLRVAADLEADGVDREVDPLVRELLRDLAGRRRLAVGLAVAHEDHRARTLDAVELLRGVLERRPDRGVALGLQRVDRAAELGGVEVADGVEGLDVGAGIVVRAVGDEAEAGTVGSLGEDSLDGGLRGSDAGGPLLVGIVRVHRSGEVHHHDDGLLARGLIGSGRGPERQQGEQHRRRQRGCAGSWSLRLASRAKGLQECLQLQIHTSRLHMQTLLAECSP